MTVHSCVLCGHNQPFSIGVPSGLVGVRSPRWSETSKNSFKCAESWSWVSGMQKKPTGGWSCAADPLGRITSSLLADREVLDLSLRTSFPILGFYASSFGCSGCDVTFSAPNLPIDKCSVCPCLEAERHESARASKFSVWRVLVGDEKVAEQVMITNSVSVCNCLTLFVSDRLDQSSRPFCYLFPFWKGNILSSKIQQKSRFIARLLTAVTFVKSRLSPQWRVQVGVEAFYLACTSV